MKFSNCVLVRVPINKNFELPIALFVIILVKKTFTNHHGVIQCNSVCTNLPPTRRPILINVYVNIWAWKTPFVFAVASYKLCIKSEVY